MRDEKEKGNKLLEDGCALVDTSGRTKQINEKSVLAIASKKFGFTILMLSKEKKKVFTKLSKLHGERRAQAIMHSVKIFYAIKEYILTCPAIYICCDGFDSGMLKHYLKQIMNIKYHEQKIRIERSLKPMFGKQNLADRLAWSVNKRGQRPNMTLNEKHFKNLNLI